MDQFAEEGLEPTLDDSYRTGIVVDGCHCALEIVDTAGREEYAALHDQYISDGDAFIIAYSVTSRTSFSHIRAYYNHIKDIKEEMRVNMIIKWSPSQHPLNSPVILVGTKNDLKAQREVSVEEGRMLAKSLNCLFIETSAKYDADVGKMFHDVVRCFRRQNPPSGLETPASSRSRKALGRLLGPRQRNNYNGLRCVFM